MMNEVQSQVAADVQEIVLADEFRESSAAVEKAAANAVDSRLALPAALCDDLLIAELNGIPDKMGFKIGEVADLLGIKQYVLRYWESEFEILKPKKASNNQRYYTKKDVENAFIIRKLLHRDRFSIEGARAALKGLKSYVRKEKDWSTLQSRIDMIQDEVDELIMDLRRFRGAFL